MTIGEIIRNRREELKMTQEELAARVGYKHKTSINKIEAGKQKIMQDKILVFANALQFTPEQLMGWDEPEPAAPVNLTEWESKHIDMYRALDQRGRDVVDYITNEEYHRFTQLQKAYQYEDDEMKVYPFAGYIAAAGSAVYPGDIPVEQIRSAKVPGADFVVGISGDSMLPTFSDRDKLYISKTTDLSYGDIGLFVVDGYYYVKEYTAGGLKSHNPNYEMIRKDREIIVIGKVIGKVE